MRILILSWYFPPVNDIGAVRVGRFAQYLHDRGHDVWVISAQREDADRSLPVGLPPERVIRTDWIDVDRVASPWTWGRTAAGGQAAVPPVQAARQTSGSKLRRHLGWHYMWLVRFPDRQGGWLPFLRHAAVKLLKQQPFDVIYASGPPFTTFIVGAQMSRRFGVPWIAEYRDGWTCDEHVAKPAWREQLDVLHEARTIRSASGIVAVSEPWAKHLEERFGKPTIAIYNGFDPTGLSASDSSPEHGQPLTITHMGSVYAGLRDPTVLFEAIAIAGLRPEELQIEFYGADARTIESLAQQKGVSDFVRARPPVPYSRALEIQRMSDVLLLLQYPGDLRNVPAKTFEYFAARRPILGLGLDEGIPARLVRERNAGLYRTDPKAIAQQLRLWVEQKREAGFIPVLPESVCAGLSRSDQLSRLETFLHPLCRSRAEPEPAAVARELPYVSVRITSMLPETRQSVVSFPPVSKPRLLVIADAEEEFDWSKPFSERETGVTTMRLQGPAQNLFKRYGLIPTYAVDYAVADQRDGYGPLLEFLRDGVCEIGAQLHPWVTPPHLETLGERYSFPGNLPRDLEFEKLRTLTERIEANLGVRPRLYRAGRYGAGPNTAGILRSLGYTIDCSVVPPGQENPLYAPDYSGAPVSPYWIGDDLGLLEIPVTKSTIGLAHKTHGYAAPYVLSETARRFRLPGILARLRLFDHIRLSPEGSTLNEAKRLTRSLLARGERVFTVSYHTPSLGIGHTPYVRSYADLQSFLAWLEGYLDFFFGEIGGMASTPDEIRRIALQQFLGHAEQAETARMRAPGEIVTTGLAQ